MEESCSFQSQLLSVMEVLAKAAVAEINRRVDDSCAVLRLEVSQSRRDIDLLKGKFSPLVKVVLNRDRQSADWDRQMDDEAPDQPQQILIKEESAEEDMWKSNSEDKLISEAEQPAQIDGFVERLHPAENPSDPGSLVSQADEYTAFPDQQLNRNQIELELVVKHEREEEPDENAAPVDSDHAFVIEDGEGQLWSPNLCRDAGEPSLSFAGQHFEPVPSAFPSQSGLHLEDMVPRIQSVKSHAVTATAARVKRRARTFGCKKPQPDEGHALSQINTVDLIPQQPQHQYRDSGPQLRGPNQESTAPNTAASSFYGHSRGSFALSRRMRTPWRSGIGEKRFSCTYCDKSFMRFSQLKEHLRSHTGEKPFSCLQCGRSFTKQCNLIRHAVVHSGEKPYECSLCGKCFTQRSSLKSHQKTAH
ncbi:hypothetical protein GBF38_016024 [Nibea albiflora]|uniref:Uncharacterized protein n=1 Tax=Nibea albiflora TaxID=240163 RepID=A0ACB7FI73_NIBAL|nr:hypothetical protein GBF38_016024 [Nibea albiflora]